MVGIAARGGALMVYTGVALSLGPAVKLFMRFGCCTRSTRLRPAMWRI
jgi:hypothetical protein